MHFERYQVEADLNILEIKQELLKPHPCKGTSSCSFIWFLQGALLLVLFQASHTIEHELTDRAQGNLETLVSQVPETAILIELTPSGEPELSASKTVKVDEVPIGSHVLVMAGQQARFSLNITFC